jgi:hypothetical protein
MSAAQQHSWIYSSKRNPCPICGRTKDGDCRINSNGQQAICHHPKNLKPSDVVNGWAFTGNIEDGRGGHFTPDKPLNSDRSSRVVPLRPRNQQQLSSGSTVPAPITGPVELAQLPSAKQEPPDHLPHGTKLEYSSSQWVKVVVDASGKRHIPHHTAAAGKQIGKAGAGPDPWPLWHEAEAMEHGRGRWIAEAEGEKCTRWLQAGGLVAVTQPGHDHKDTKIEARYRRLAEATVAGIVYLADNDKTGRDKADWCASAAAAVGLSFITVHAADVWPEIPKGGSIDDAPGSAADRVAALQDAIPAALERHQQQQQTQASTSPYRILGWCPDRQRIHYQHRETGQIASIKPAAQAGALIPLAPIEWWASLYPSGKSGGAIDWAAACSGVIDDANRAGVFALDRLRGRGLWLDRDRIVWHLGDRLEVDGQPVPLIDHRSANHYPRLPALEVASNLPQLSDAEGQEIQAAVSAMGWGSPLDPIHLLGWAVLANVGGALEKRPVLQLTSRFGSGKTYTRERVLEPLLAGLAISRSNSTEAGIRQLLKADSLPVLIDESEGEDHTRRDGHLRLARLSYDGSPTDRGTTNGQALSFAVRSAVALVGINCTISNPAERSRTVVVGREQLPQAEWSGVDRRLLELRHDPQPAPGCCAAP